MDVYVMPSMLQGSLLTRKQQGIKDSMTEEPELLNSALETKCKIGRILRCPSEISQLVEQYPTYCGEACSR